MKIRVVDSDDNEMEPIDARKVRGAPFAVHRAINMPGEVFSITHLPTGKALPKDFPDEQAAMQFARDLWKGLDAKQRQKAQSDKHATVQSALQAVYLGLVGDG